ncbi:MAG: PIN domain-containing protein [Steroidobacteraceae bacterium]
MLVDSSVWIAFLRGDATAGVELLTAALQRSLPVWLAPPILQEVLQGADRPERFDRWDRVLGELPLLVAADARATSRAAARLYARCRWAGFTPRSANDCLIAIHAIEHRMPLLHGDRDFVRMARIEPRLKLLPAA